MSFRNAVGIFHKVLLVAFASMAMISVSQAKSLSFSVDEFDFAADKTITLDGEIMVPDTATWPVVFVLHGCAGVMQWSRPVLEEHARFYRARGFATIILDSWRPRHIDGVCNPQTPEARQYGDPATRVVDIETVTAYLATLPGFDGRILLDGLSHGGWTALNILSTFGGEPIKARVTGIVAWYPACGGIDTINKIPTLILTGGKDANPFTSPEVCVNAGKQFDWVDTVLFKEATHAFDFPYPAHVDPLNGMMRYDGQAKDEAYKRIGEWLDEHGIENKR